MSIMFINLWIYLRASERNKDSAVLDASYIQQHWSIRYAHIGKRLTFVNTSNVSTAFKHSDIIPKIAITSSQ
jgi:hypothetical protein